MPTPLPKRLDVESKDSPSGIVADSRRTRPLFFDGKFLTAADLNREQSYLITRQADLARSLGFGVVDGLRVERSDRTASDVAAAAASVRIHAGHGLTPAGEAVVLPSDIVVDLSDVPRLESLNASFGLARRPQQPFYNLSGLFVLGLRAVEYTSNPTPVFPPSLQGSQPLQDGEIIEATAVTLVPYESAAALNDPPRARARVAREIFLEQRPPKLPAGVLPLAMIYLRGGFLQWTDEFLVRREAGDDDRFGFGFAPRALAEAHFLHYRELLQEVPAQPIPGRLAATDFFEILPPVGPLPPGAVNLADFTQAFFPPEARVELTIVPEDELAGLMEEGLDQPPLDLGLKSEDNDALALLLLAPVPRAGYREAVEELGKLRPLLRHVAPSLLSQQRPLQAIQRLNELLDAKTKAGQLTAPTTAEVEAPIADAAWAKLLGAVPALWYVRRRNLPYASDLASKALPAKTPIAILVPPQSVLGNPGEKVSFRVTAIGSGPLSYQWRKAGAPINGATQSELEFASVAAGDVASYDVIVSNDAGAVTSSPASLALREKPTITLQPKNVTATVGQDISFTVAATGTPPLRFQWRKEGEIIPGATDARLALTRIQAADKASYDVTVANEAGTVTSDPGILAVELAAPPTITGQPQSVSAPIGTNVLFAVVATGTPPLTYQWRRNGETIPGALAEVLAINDVQNDKAATYDVAVSNAAGSVISAPAVLTIQPAPVVLPPTITGQPRSVDAPVNSSVNFSIAVAGTAPFTFQWRKNGKPVDGVTDATLVLNSVQPVADGSYDVVVTNGAGTVTSAAAILTVETAPVLQPPTITAQPRNIATPANTTVNFGVSVAGTAPFRFQWRRNAIDLPDATGSSLVLADVQPAIVGSYDVVVTNEAGTATSVAALLTVEEAPPILPPTITGQPRNIATPANTTVNFDVAVTGTAPLRFQWRKDGTTIGGATDATLVLTNVQPAHGGRYDVVVTNDAGTITSAAATLTVDPAPTPQPPALTRQPQSVTTPADTSVNFSVAVTGTAPLTFQWRRNGTPLEGATSATLLLPGVEAAQAGSYDVLVTNNAGSVTSASALLTIEAGPSAEPPAITTQPQSVTTPANTGVNLSVAVTGTAPLKFQWRKNGTEIADANKATLAFKALQTADAGNYDVIVTNSAGEVTSAMAVLIVDALPNVLPPTVTVQPRNVATPPGPTVFFRVELGGTGPMTLQWRKNGAAINGATSATLVLPNVQAADAGNYDVVVTNAVGTVTSVTASLTIETAPGAQAPTIVTHPQSVTTPPSATILFSITMTGSAPFKVQWRKNGLPVTEASGATLVLNNVQPADAGTYDAVVTNSAGSATSAGATLTIEGRPPVAPPTITEHPQSTTAPVGSNVNFHVGIAGTAPFKIQWRMNDIELPGATGSWLVLNSITPANGGRYDVLVGNEAGTIQSEAAALDVETSFLKILRQPRDIAVALESAAGFTVRAEGAPSLSFQWFRSKTATSAPVAIDGATEPTLKFEHVTREDLGFYRVEVSNGAGLVETSNVVKLSIA